MVNVIGLGYIGLPTALMLAAHGIDVVGTDYNSMLVSKLNSGKTTFKEEGLEELYAAACGNNISFSTDYQKADVYIVAVPTPYIKSTKRIDPTYVINAVREVLEQAPLGAILVIESTISPGTIDKYIRPIIAETGYVAGEDIHVVHAPERIIPGRMIYELQTNNRTVGADDQETGRKVADLYASFCKGKITVTDIKTAEMTKVVENTFRDINIAFANELSKICREAGLDVREIIKIANMHPRVNILNPGPGVGGHCISVDPWFLVGDYPASSRLIKTARDVNDSMPEFVLARAAEVAAQNGIEDYGKIGVYGLTYKENVDDIRESPTLQMIECLKAHFSDKTLRFYDPYVEDDIVGNQVHDLSEFLDGLEMVIIMVGHNQLVENLELLTDLVVLDTRNICENRTNVYRL